jgi:hypothetical protein
MKKLKEFFDLLAVIAIILSSAAVTIGVSIYVMRLPPIAYKSDITKVEKTAATKSDIAKVEKTAVTALATTQTEQKRQDAASALVATTVGTHGEKIKNVKERLTKDEYDIATIKTRVDILDGYSVPAAAPVVKHAHQH